MVVNVGVWTNKNMNNKTVFIVRAFTAQQLSFIDKSIGGLRNQNKAVIEADVVL